MNVYEYVNGMPLFQVDPFGECRLMTYAATGPPTIYAKGGYLQGAALNQNPKFDTGGYLPSGGKGPTAFILCIKEEVGKGAVDCNGCIEGRKVIKRYYTNVGVNGMNLWTVLSRRKIPLPFFGAKIGISTNLGSVSPLASANAVCAATKNRWTFLSIEY